MMIIRQSISSAATVAGSARVNTTIEVPTLGHSARDKDDQTAIAAESSSLSLEPV